MSAVKQSRQRNKTAAFKIEGISEQLFINEHLTMDNKLLFKETRETIKAKHYKYAWVKDGNIYIRKDDSSRVLQVKSRDTLSKLK